MVLAQGQITQQDRTENTEIDLIAYKTVVYDRLASKISTKEGRLK